MPLFDEKARIVQRDDDLQYQRRVEYLAAFALVVMMLLAAFAFAHSRNTEILDRFNRDLHLAITFTHFTVACVVGAVLTPLTVFPPARFWQPGNRRTLYLACASPMLFYTVPVGYVVLNSDTANPITGVAYVALYLLFIVVGIAVFRPVRRD